MQNAELNSKFKIQNAECKIIFPVRLSLSSLLECAAIKCHQGRKPECRSMPPDWRNFPQN